MLKYQKFEKVLIEIMYERGEINRATYEKVITKLSKEAIKNEKNK